MSSASLGDSSYNETMEEWPNLVTITFVYKNWKIRSKFFKISLRKLICKFILCNEMTEWDALAKKISELWGLKWTEILFSSKENIFQHDILPIKMLSTLEVNQTLTSSRCLRSSWIEPIQPILDSAWNSVSDMASPFVSSTKSSNLYHPNAYKVCPHPKSK